MVAKTTPNLFDLHGDGIVVSYSTSSVAGKPQFSYRKGQQSLNFSGDEIRTLDTGIGKLVSVVIAKSVDREFTTFSVLLPTILLSDGQKVSFHTIGITTVTTTTIGGPVQGAQQTYHASALTGTAQLVEF
jgi:hypothetical protein